MKSVIRCVMASVLNRLDSDVISFANYSVRRKSCVNTCGMVGDDIWDLVAFDVFLWIRWVI